jgi:hypothetical protein
MPDARSPRAVFPDGRSLRRGVISVSFPATPNASTSVMHNAPDSIVEPIPGPTMRFLMHEN